MIYSLFLFLFLSHYPFHTLTSLYLYDTLPGYAVIAIRLGVYVISQIDLRQTWIFENEYAKKNFYLVLAA